MTLQHSWNGAPGFVLTKQNNGGADLAMLRGDGVIDGATTSSPTSPNTSDDYTRYIDLDTFNDHPYFGFLPTSSAPGIGISIDDQDDGSTTWKQGQIPTATSPSPQQQQHQQHRTSLADMFADYSSPVSSPVPPPPSSGDAQPQAIAAASVAAATMTATANNGNINAPAMSSSFTDSNTTAWSGSAYGSPYLAFAAAGMMSGLPASDPGVGGGMSAFSSAAGFAGGVGSSAPTWFASAAQTGMAGIPIASPSQHPQVHQQQIQHSYLPTVPPPQSSQSSQSHPQQQHPTSFQQQHLEHAFTFSSPSPLSPTLSHSGVSTSLDNFDALFGSYSSSSGVSGLGLGDLGIAPNLIHNSPPPPHTNTLSPFAQQQQQTLYSSSYEVPWDAGLMEGVDDVSSPHDENALGLGLDGGNGVQPQRGRRMRRTTVRAAASPTSPNFALEHMRDEDMDSNASTRHDEGSDIDDDGQASDEDAVREDGADSDDDYEDGEYRPRRPARRRRVSHTYVGGHTGELSFSPPALSTSAPNTSGTCAARDTATNGQSPLLGPLSNSNSRTATRRQGTIRGAPGSTRATTTSATTTGITIHTANGITYASLPSASASSAPSDGLSAAYLAANLIGGGGGPSSSMTKRSRGRQVPTVRLADTPSLPTPGDSSSRSPVRPTSITNHSEKATATGERSTSSRARRRSRLASEAAAEDNYDGVYEEGNSGASQNDDDDSEYDENGTSSARSGRSSGPGGRSLRASTRNARNTRRKVKASTSLTTLHAGSGGGAASGPGAEDIIVGGVGAGNMSWSDGRTRSYVCRVNGCGKCFQRGEHLKRHIRSIHTNDKRM